MMKIVLGVLVGVILTVSAYSLLKARPEGDTSTSVIEPEPLRAGTDRSQAHNARASQGDGIDTPESVASSERERSIAEEEPRGAERAPVAHPIALPPAFEWLASSLGHQRLEAELMDSWSIEAQTQLTRYFSERPELSGKYGFPTVNCRRTGCEVLVAAYDLDESALRNGFRQDLLESDWADQPLAENLLTLAESNSENGVATLAWFIMKQQPAIID